MDIDNLYTLENHEKGSKLQLEDQAGKKLDVYIILAGMDSKKFRKAIIEMRRDMLNESDLDPDDARAKALASISIGWDGLTHKGKPLKFDTTEAEKLFLNAPYLMDQIDAFIADRENFMKG